VRLQSTRSSLPWPLLWSKLLGSFRRLFLRRGRRSYRGGGALAAGLFQRRTNDNKTPVCAGHCAANQNYFFRLAHLHDLKILYGHTLIPKVTRHPHVLPNASRRRSIAYCTTTPMGFRTMRRALSVEVVFLHHTLKAF